MHKNQIIINCNGSNLHQKGGRGAGRTFFFLQHQFLGTGARIPGSRRLRTLHAGRPRRHGVLRDHPRRLRRAGHPALWRDQAQQGRDNVQGVGHHSPQLTAQHLGEQHNHSRAVGPRRRHLHSRLPRQRLRQPGDNTVHALPHGRPQTQRRRGRRRRCPRRAFHDRRHHRPLLHKLVNRRVLLVLRQHQLHHAVVPRHREPAREPALQGHPRLWSHLGRTGRVVLPQHAGAPRLAHATLRHWRPQRPARPAHG